jgi:four helix bundle protein
MKEFRHLQVWHRAHDLALHIYRATDNFPRGELCGLRSQLRRAVASIGANLAEGCGRNGNAELARYCAIAMGSASELEYHLLLAKDLQFIDPAEYEGLNERTIEVKRMLTALQKKINADR